MDLSCNSRIFHRSFENEMAYSSNFGYELQMMVGIGKEYGFTLNFDMPWLFTSRKMELPRKMANSQSIRLPDGLLYPRVNELTLETRLPIAKILPKGLYRFMAITIF